MMHTCELWKRAYLRVSYTQAYIRVWQLAFLIFIDLFISNFSKFSG